VAGRSAAKTARFVTRRVSPVPANLRTRGIQNIYQGMCLMDGWNVFFCGGSGTVDCRNQKTKCRYQHWTRQIKNKKEYTKDARV
jgi:hypothetical protein